MINYYFPPKSHPGVQRPLKFCKYLQKFGYGPVVLTCGNMSWKSLDKELYESEVSGKIDVRETNAVRFESIGEPWLGQYFFKKLVLKLETLFFEDRMDWAISTKAEALRIVREEGIDLVCTSGPPHSVHMVGSFLKKQTGIPWVMDLRDPIVEYVYPESISLLSRWTDILRKKVVISAFEKKWIDQADAVISVTQPLCDDLRKTYPGLSDRFHTITNGFDEDDFVDIPALRDDKDKFTMLYTGRFWVEQTPSYFLKGLELALQNKPELKQYLSVIFIGGDYSVEQKKMLNEPQLAGVVHYLGAKTHSEALSYQMGSDVNILIISTSVKDGGGGIFTGKIFEYVRAGRPILAIVPKGVARDLVVDNKLGVSVDHDDHKGIADAVCLLYDRWKSGSLTCADAPADVRARYSRENLTGELASIFDRCLKEVS